MGIAAGAFPLFFAKGCAERGVESGAFSEFVIEFICGERAFFGEDGGRDERLDGAQDLLRVVFSRCGEGDRVFEDHGFLADDARAGEQGAKGAFPVRRGAERARQFDGEFLDHFAHAPRLVGEQLSAERGVFHVYGMPPVFGEQFVEEKQKPRRVFTFRREPCGNVDEGDFPFSRPDCHEFFDGGTHIRARTAFRLVAFGTDGGKKSFRHRFFGVLRVFRCAVEG